jgi:AmiR/NasT family two-component response regulator
MRRPHRVLIAGDDVVHRWDLAQTLIAQGLSVVGQDRVGPHAVMLAAALRPDIVLIIVTSNHAAAQHAAETIRTRHPATTVVPTGTTTRDSGVISGFRG